MGFTSSETVRKSDLVSREGTSESVLSSTKSRLRKSLAITDFIVIGVTVSLARWIRFGTDDDTVSLDWPAYSLISVGLGIDWMVALTVTQSRSATILGIGSEECRRVISATLGIFGLLAILLSHLR